MITATQSGTLSVTRDTLSPRKLVYRFKNEVTALFSIVLLSTV
jgi:hypothetical protein